MAAPSSDRGARIIPTLRYRDAAAAIDWLCRAFGFARHLVVEGEGGRIAHAELTFAGGMIMLGSTGDDAFGRLTRVASVKMVEIGWPFEVVMGHAAWGGSCRRRAGRPA
jgi:uncharacterized glyoxalase superfamily protein PhnB